ncbi:NUDIX domain-containing protein [Actinomadura violacea]|uniref:NUDIX domain-containing protein n=1 Tax=Actinomadura violacea TaxID=2819934 RepID=A0ABS3S9U0_9ACTN|nr:NUDIX domain-containing protein [Actinomadura violacea]MBO2465767.1 NUDIX domain-containing protein [Actinomadura violacea]
MTTTIAAPQTAAHAVLTDSRGLVLLVHPAYKSRWHLPGGYVREGELPSAGVAREVHEELSVSPAFPPSPALVAWAPNAGDRLLLYYSAKLSAQQVREVRTDGHEIIGYQWCSPDALNEWLHPALADRTRLTLEATRRRQTLFTEPRRATL